MVHDSFTQLIQEQSQDLNSHAEDIEMYPLMEETGGIHKQTSAKYFEGLASLANHKYRTFTSYL